MYEEYWWGVVYMTTTTQWAINWEYRPGYAAATVVADSTLYPPVHGTNKQELCDGVFANANFQIQYNSWSVNQCVACQSCAVDCARVGCKDTDPGNCVQCNAGQRVNKEVGCEACPDVEYQTQTKHGLTSCVACPYKAF